MTDTREEIIEAMRQAIWGIDWDRGTDDPLTRYDIAVMARAAYAASPLERYRAALEEIRDRRAPFTDQRAIAERALKEEADSQPKEVEPHEHKYRSGSSLCVVCGFPYPGI